MKYKTKFFFIALIGSISLLIPIPFVLDSMLSIVFVLLALIFPICVKIIEMITGEIEIEENSK